MELFICTGFLGSGKTTLVIALVRALHEQRGSRVAVIVNDFGAVGIDEKVMRQWGLNVWELASGCVCCQLSGDLLNTMQVVEENYAPDLLIVEPSGVAEPSNITKVLPYYKGHLGQVKVVAVVDPLRLSMLYEVVTPLIQAQIAGADVVALNKIDACDDDQIASTLTILEEIRPGIPVVRLAAEMGINVDALVEVLLKP